MSRKNKQSVSANREVLTPTIETPEQSDVIAEALSEELSEELEVESSEEDTVPFTPEETEAADTDKEPAAQENELEADMQTIDVLKAEIERLKEQIEKLGITEPENLEEQALSLVGTDIYEKLVKGYTEKQWGRDCKELPAFIIKRLPVRFVYDNNYFNDPYQGIPKGGYTGIVEKLFDGMEIKLETAFEDFCVKNTETGMYESRDGVHTFEKVLYTGMIDEFYHYQLGELAYRSLQFETQVLEGEENYQGNAVVNYTEREVPYTRIIEHKHFEFGKQPDTVITREYPKDWHRGDEPYYPVNDEKNGKLYQEYVDLAKKEKNVLFGGRLGQYTYYDMDKVIRAALTMAKEELA